MARVIISIPANENEPYFCDYLLSIPYMIKYFHLRNIRKGYHSDC